MQILQLIIMFLSIIIFFLIFHVQPVFFWTTVQTQKIFSLLSDKTKKDVSPLQWDICGWKLIWTIFKLKGLLLSSDWLTKGLVNQFFIAQ